MRWPRIARLFQHQQRTTPVLPPPVFEDAWHQPWSTPVKLKNFLTAAAVATSTYTGPIFPIPPQPNVVDVTNATEQVVRQSFQYQAKAESLVVQENITVDKWFEPWTDPVRIKVGLRASLQDIEADAVLDPRTQIQYIAWYEPLNEPVRLKPGLAANKQQVTADIAFNEDTTFESKWHEPWSEPVRLKPGLRPYLNQFFAATTIDPPTQIQYEGWYQPLSEPVRFKPGLQSRYQLQPASNIFPLEVIFEDKWHFPWSEPVRLKPGLRASLQSVDATPVLDPRTQIQYISWYEPLSEPVWPKKGLRANLQPVTAEIAFNADAGIVAKWFEPLSDPVRQKSGLRANYQQDQAETIFVPSGEIVTLDKWYQPLNEPTRRRGLLAAEQQYFTISQFPPAVFGTNPMVGFYSPPIIFKGRLIYQAYAAPVLEIITPDKWFEPFSEPVRVKPGLRIYLNQTAPTLVLNPPTQIQVIGWYEPLSDPVRQKPGLRSSLQLTAAGPVLNPPTQIQVIGWYEPLNEPVRTKRGLPAYEQIIPSLVTAETITLDKWYEPFSDPVRIKQGLLASRQSFLTQDLRLPTIFPDRWWEPLSEPVRLRRFAAALQQSTVIPTQIIANQVIVTLFATETNADAGLFLVEVYNRAVRASVSVVEIQGSAITAASVETQPTDSGAISIKEVPKNG